MIGIWEPRVWPCALVGSRSAPVRIVSFGPTRPCSPLQFNKRYTSTAEQSRRFAIFSETLARINAQNELEASTGGRCGVVLRVGGFQGCVRFWVGILCVRCDGRLR